MLLPDSTDIKLLRSLLGRRELPCLPLEKVLRGRELDLLPNETEDGGNLVNPLDCRVTCLSESDLLLSGHGAEYLLDEVKARNAHYYGAEQRLRAVVGALDIAGLAEESYRDFRSQKGQQVGPLPRRMRVWVGAEEAGTLADGTIVERLQKE